MKRIVSVILATLLLLSLAGCSVDEPAETTNPGPTELWLVTEANSNDAINVLIEEFERTHENISIRLDLLPMEDEERAAYLESIRVEIMSGGGPDLYLFPMSNVVRSLYASARVEPLFADVELSMRNGMFMDIREYFDADEDLHKNGLNQTVMDAGTVGDARYVLPLSYEFDVLMVDPQRLAESGLDQEQILSGNILDIMDEALESAEKVWACGAEPYSLGMDSSLSYFPEIIDYDSGTVNLTAEELTLFLKKDQQLAVLIADEYMHRGINAQDYFTKGIHLGEGDFPMKQGSLTHSVYAAAIAKAAEREVTILPIRSTEGTLIADVVYYGAVGSGCDEPQLAYEFLRMFLKEDAQHGSFIAQIGGWPVRTEGSVEAMWELIKSKSVGQEFYEEGQRPRYRKYLGADITGEDLPILTTEIDEVRFRIPNIEWDMVAHIPGQLNDANGVPTDVDIDELAETVIEALRWHLAEG